MIRRIQNERFVLDPDFQRSFVWDKDKQSRLIESILLRIPLPVFYVAEDNEGRLIVVDGRQRLTTLLHFLDNRLALKLKDRPELDGKRFDGLDVRLQNRVEDCQLLFYIIDRSVPERARLDIFERVNGGEVLTRQQMRNAIYNGPATAFLRDEAETALFQEATGGSLNALKMQDREMIKQRFFPGCDLRVSPIDGVSAVSLRLRSDSRSDFQRPQNVGFGLTQLFPIIVSLLAAREGELLLIENPEVHLHPRAQQAIGMLLAETAASGVQVVLETHSDHVLNGVRLSVKQKKLPATNVRVHFFAQARPPPSSPPLWMKTGGSIHGRRGSLTNSILPSPN